MMFLKTAEARRRREDEHCLPRKFAISLYKHPTPRQKFRCENMATTFSAGLIKQFELFFTTEIRKPLKSTEQSLKGSLNILCVSAAKLFTYAPRNWIDFYFIK
jgi:hypothetical protein